MRLPSTPFTTCHCSGQQEGPRELQDMLYNLLCTLASCLGTCSPGLWGAQLQDLEHTQAVPQTKCPVPSERKGRKRGMGLEALTAQAQQGVDDDSVLMLRQLYLTSLAYQGLERRRPPIKGGSWVERPSDPAIFSSSPSAWRCSSIWNTQAYKVWAKHLKHRQASPTISTDLELAHWRQMFCQHGTHRVECSLKSGDLSRCPWDMMRGLAQAISNHCAPMLSPATQVPLVERTKRPLVWTASMHCTGYKKPAAPLPLPLVPLAQSWGAVDRPMVVAPSTQSVLLKTKAHQRVKMLPTDWRLQVAELSGEWWVNKVGTYSAQLYWGRAAALILRLLYALFPMVDWGFVWMTSHLAEINAWLGFVVHPNIPQVQMAAPKHVIVLSLLDKLIQNEVFAAKEIERALGRIQWATAVCPLTKSLMQPFWACKMAVTASGKPKTVRLLALLLRHLFQVPYKQLSPFLPLSTWWGCSDASASNQGDSCVGGWISDLKSPEKAQVWWFHFQVTQDQFSWAFKEGDPQKRIAAIELLGTLVLCRLLLARQQSESSSVRLPIGSDNQGNVFSLRSFASKKPHTAAVLMEFVWQLHLAGCALAPCHVPRELNQWADELTHVDYGGFSDEREALSHFILLPWLMSGTHVDFSTPT